MGPADHADGVRGDPSALGRDPRCNDFDIILLRFSLLAAANAAATSIDSGCMHAWLGVLQDTMIDAMIDVSR